MHGLMNMDKRLEDFAVVDPVCAAASAAFGFVYIHPFEDGNGRLHRFLVHHVLAKLRFTPPSVIFPISAAMLRDVTRYTAVLDTVSQSIRPFINFTLDDERADDCAHNDTADLYRYFDATPHAEYLYSCIQETINVDLRKELHFLSFYDEALKATLEIVDMPDQESWSLD